MVGCEVGRMSDQSSSQPLAAGTGTPTDLGRETPIIRVIDNSVKALETHRGYMERDLKETRDDMRDVRDRLSKLEVRVSLLPSKMWIGSAVMAAVVFLSAVIGPAAKLTGH